MESEGEKNKISFSFDVGGGKKLRLIDMANEDDYLIASPLFDSLEDLRLSVTLDNNSVDEDYKCKGIRPFAETLQQSEPQLHLSSNSSMTPGRPSYMRKSLAWDTAFFTNDGVLDADELFLLNKGLKPHSLHSIQEDTHLRRSEPALRKKVDASTQKKTYKHVFKEESASSRQSLTKSKNQTARSEEFKRMSSKPPKESGPLKDLSTGGSERRLLGKKNGIMSKEEKSVQTRAVPSFASRNFTPSNSQQQRVFATSLDISKNHMKRKTESTRGKLSASVSDITPSRYKQKSKRRATDLRHSTQSLSAISDHSSRKSPSGSIVARSLIENNKENPDSKFSSFLEGEISTPLPFSTRGKLSGLRMPSPTIGYFNECQEKPSGMTEIGTSPFQLQMCDKLPSKKVPISALDAKTRNRKHGFVDIQAPPSYGKHKTGKHSRNKIDHSTTLKGEEKKIREISLSMLDKQNKMHKSKTRINGARIPFPQKNGNESQDNKKRSSPHIGDQVHELSKLLGVINLNEGEMIEPEQSHYTSSALATENIPQTH